MADCRWAHHWTNKGAIRTSFQYDAAGHEVYNASHLFHTAIPFPPAMQAKRVAGFVLPRAQGHNVLHVFALSVEPVGTGEMMGERIVVPFVSATRRWEDTDTGKAQVITVAVRNPLSGSRHADRDAWIDRPISIALAGTGFTTVKEGYIPRLMPGDEVRVEVLVTPTAANAEFIDSRVELSVGHVSWAVPVVVEGAALVHDFSAWNETDSDIEQHTSPGWYNSAKFGIFIHWGLFSVPAWAPVPRYAEWYDFWIHDDKPGMEAYEHHLATWGKDFVYDDFIPMFTAAAFNASEWAELVADAGAKYFVFTTKHHDGYALFDTKGTSDRNSLLLGPKRDFLRELMDAAAHQQPHLKRGTYFSMPEWFNPLYGPHGRVSFPGGPARNPYTGAEEPYTGFVDVEDYISGLQVPQMRILADDYATDLIWCDIGLDNGSAPFVAEWYGAAARAGRQVAISNRCGIGGDFDTPEMEKFGAVEMSKWETCASMDPFSFGYSADTKDAEYRNATDVIHTLVDITAKGGNFLLNIGPRADGSLVPAVVANLREAGRWLKTHGRAIYGTAPFPLLPEVRDEYVHVQFTRTPEAFYIISLRDIQPEFVLEAPLPILPCDQVVFVTEQQDVRVPWSYTAGVLTVDMAGVAESEYTDRIAYVFEVKYGQCA
jgi:alpha-L-fucosidase